MISGGAACAANRSIVLAMTDASLCAATITPKVTLSPGNAGGAARRSRMFHAVNASSTVS